MPPRSAPARSVALAAEQEAARLAYQGAKRADPVRSALFDRLMAESIEATAIAPAATAVEMWRRSRILFWCFEGRASSMRR
jgi:hypothetical protein